MIPLHLRIENFLSYRSCELSFQGLHTACICGINGSGKSSLLESVTWALWGKCRASTEDDVIRSGAEFATVDITFLCEGTVYRVLRNRPKDKTGALEFQIGDSEQNFRSISQRTLQGTQQAIEQVLKMDYETFINSAYLRQGRADEFTLKKPAERKRVLAEILRLSQYDELAEQSRELEKEFKLSSSSLKEEIEHLETALGKRPQIEQRTLEVTHALHVGRAKQQEIEQKGAQLSQLKHQRETLLAQQKLGIQQLQNLSITLEREAAQHKRQHEKVAQHLKVLEQEGPILEGCALYQKLQEEDQELYLRFKKQQDLLEKKRNLEESIEQERSTIAFEVKTLESRTEDLKKQRADYQQILQQKPKVEEALAHLSEAKEKLKRYDACQSQVAPRIRERQPIEQQIYAEQTKLETQANHLRYEGQKIQGELSKLSFYQRQLEKVTEQITVLQKRQVYLQRVLDKGQDRKLFKEQLELQKNHCENQLKQLTDKRNLLLQPDAQCPLCKQDLHEDHLLLIQESNAQEEQELSDNLLILTDQLSVVNHEIRVLREEYGLVKKELEALEPSLQQKGTLEQQLQALEQRSQQAKELKIQEKNFLLQLERQDFAHELRAHLAHLDEELQQLNYDEKDHALARDQVERWRWADIKVSELNAAQKQIERIEAELPPSQEKLARLEAQLATRTYAEESQQKWQRMNNQLTELGYNQTAHRQIRQELQENQHWLLKQQALAQSKDEFPKDRELLRQSEDGVLRYKQEREALETQQEDLAEHLAQFPDPTEELVTLEQELRLHRASQEQWIAERGALEQSLKTLDDVANTIAEKKARLKDDQHQQRVYRELAKAFGKDGIQALIIENVLPELEEETNRLLSRLTDSQLHVQFVTQKAAKTVKKMIDTLDILIADARGTRPYETYSGGEAFRVNFAIRLALSRLLARRAGAALQTLIIDEGFGTQDSEGRERLVGAINTVARDFACILVITHISDLKEAFQSRIEVLKTDEGSQLSVIL
jgi:DNA repair protein SbcC/Rad50